MYECPHSLVKFMSHSSKPQETNHFTALGLMDFSLLERLSDSFSSCFGSLLVAEHIWLLCLRREKDDYFHLLCCKEAKPF